MSISSTGSTKTSSVPCWTGSPPAPADQPSGCLHDPRANPARWPILTTIEPLERGGANRSTPGAIRPSAWSESLHPTPNDGTGPSGSERRKVDFSAAKRGFSIFCNETMPMARDVHLGSVSGVNRLATTDDAKRQRTGSRRGSGREFEVHVLPCEGDRS